MIAASSCSRVPNQPVLYHLLSSAFGGELKPNCNCYLNLMNLCIAIKGNPISISICCRDVRDVRNVREDCIHEYRIVRIVRMPVLETKLKLSMQNSSSSQRHCMRTFSGRDCSGGDSGSWSMRRIHCEGLQLVKRMIGKGCLMATRVGICK